MVEDPKTAILSRYARILRDWQGTIEIITQATEKQQLLNAEFADCQAAGRIFGFDLVPEYMLWSAQVAGNSADAGPALVAPEIMPPAPPRTVKDMILSAAKDAHPKSVRAADITKMLANQGFSLHSKTVGMTLYRLSKEGSMKREGKSDWKYVREEERSINESDATTKFG